MEPQLTVKVPTIPQQEGSKDCGVYAIAYAYHVTQLRDRKNEKSLGKVLSQRKDAPFPKG